MAVRYDISADQGATLHLTFRWRQPRTPDEEANDQPGRPVDLDGFTGRMQLRTDHAADDVALDLTTENGRIILGATDPDETPDLGSGLVTLWVDADTTSALEAQTYVYDLEMVSGADFVTRFLEGKFKVRPEVTR